MNGGWVRENKVKVGDKIKIRKSRTRKKRGGVRRRGRQYHPLETLASNEMLELFRNTVTREFVPTAMDRCRSDHTKRCLSELLIAQGLPHNKNEFTAAQLETYYGIIETCKPKNIAVPWNTQSGEGQGGGRKKKTRKKRGGTANLCKLFHEQNNGIMPIDADTTVIDKYCRDHGDTNIPPNPGNLCEVTTGNCWLPANIQPRRMIRVNRRGNNQGNRRSSVASTSLAPLRLTRQGGKRRKKKTRKKRAGVKIDIGSFWTRINPPLGHFQGVWQVIGIISDKGKGIIQIAKPEYRNTMMRSYEKENFFRLYKPFNEKPGGDALPQKVPEESGGDKIGGMKKAGPVTISRAEYERRQQRRREREEELWRQQWNHGLRVGSEWTKNSNAHFADPENKIAIDKNYHKDEKIIYKILQLVNDGGKKMILVTFEAKLRGMMSGGLMRHNLVIEKESFLENYKPFNEKPGGDALPQKVPEESGGDKIGGRRRDDFL
jgi:hypothetical protein